MQQKKVAHEFARGQTHQTNLAIYRTSQFTLYQHLLIMWIAHNVLKGYSVSCYGDQIVVDILNHIRHLFLV